jgi:hypothetical protein
MQEAQEVKIQKALEVRENKERKIYKKLMSVLHEMMDFDNKIEEMTPFSLLIKGIAIDMSEYEDNKGWMKRKK